MQATAKQTNKGKKRVKQMTQLFVDGQIISYTKLANLYLNVNFLPWGWLSVIGLSLCHHKSGQSQSYFGSSRAAIPVWFVSASASWRAWTWPWYIRWEAWYMRLTSPGRVTGKRGFVEFSELITLPCRRLGHKIDRLWTLFTVRNVDDGPLRNTIPWVNLIPRIKNRGDHDIVRRVRLCLNLGLIDSGMPCDWSSVQSTLIVGF